MSRKLYPVLLSILFFQSSSFSQSFNLLKDINAGNAGSSYFNSTNVNGVLYFRPDDGVHGDELWKSNGTAAGTVLVKDINPGATGSELQEFINVNGVLFFRANDGVHGTELWKSDGTAAGTAMVKDILPGEDGGILSTLFASNGTVYFQANDGTHGTELWKSDGTEAGTILLKDIYPGVIPSGFLAGTPYSGNPGNFTSANGIVYFAASGGNETHEIWKTDGTVAGTTLIKDIYSGIQGYALSNFITLNGALYFTVYGGASGNELWKCDGTAAGTTLIKAAMSGDNFNNHGTVMNGALYFLEGDGLWKSDGTTSGTVLLKEKGGSFASSPELLTSINGLLYFTGNDDLHGLELWKSNGTAAGTVLLKDIYDGTTSSDINAFAVIGNKLMFSANDGIHGNEIWVSDGTETGTKMAQDIEPGSGSSIESQFYELKANIIEVNGKIFTSATTTAFGNEIWVANAPADGPLPVELLEFKGSLVNHDGFLQWKTENEINTSVFIVERSTDASNYSPIGTILASNTTGVHGYTLTDPNVTSLGVTIVYYRLRQVDLDGKIKYSGIVTLSIENKNITIQLYPNPVMRRINLTIISNQPEKLQWRFTDNIGRIIKAGTYSILQGINLVSEDIGFISSGIYYMQLFNGSDLKQTVKVVKQ